GANRDGPTKPLRNFEAGFCAPEIVDTIPRNFVARSLFVATCHEILHAGPKCPRPYLRRIGWSLMYYSWRRDPPGRRSRRRWIAQRRDVYVATSRSRMSRKLSGADSQVLHCSVSTLSFLLRPQPPPQEPASSSRPWSLRSA